MSIGQVKLSADVSEALSHGRAVVALESTIISHGILCCLLAQLVNFLYLLILVCVE